MTVHPLLAQPFAPTAVVLALLARPFVRVVPVVLDRGAPLGIGEVEAEGRDAVDLDPELGLRRGQPSQMDLEPGPRLSRRLTSGIDQRDQHAELLAHRAVDGIAGARLSWQPR